MTTTKLKPDWAGEDWLSRLVNMLIQTKPIYALMKQQVRKVLIKTAEKMVLPGGSWLKIWIPPGESPGQWGLCLNPGRSGRH